jgi:hypothetical protein
MAKAQPGGIAREAIAVATTLALSWKPFKKSKTSAIAMNMINSKLTEATSGKEEIWKAFGAIFPKHQRLSMHF